MVAKDSSRFMVTMPNDLKKELEKLAEENERSLSSQIVYMVKQQLKGISNANNN